MSSAEANHRQEEYLPFNEELRLRQPALVIPDTVEFVRKQAILRDKPILLKVFRLNCFCRDQPRQQLPVVEIGSLRSDGPKYGLVDVMAPVQSFLTKVRRGVDALISEDSVSKFLSFESISGLPGRQTYIHHGRMLIFLGMQAS